MLELKLFEWTGASDMKNMVRDHGRQAYLFIFIAPS